MTYVLIALGIVVYLACGVPFARLSFRNDRRQFPQTYGDTPADYLLYVFLWPIWGPMELLRTWSLDHPDHLSLLGRVGRFIVGDRRGK